jgi:methylmalonyl-CoA epimerase
VAFLSVGDTRIELLEPLGDDCPVARFLERRWPGLHHIAFRVEELDGVLARLDRAGVPLVDHRGRPGAHGTRVAFLHPSALGGVLVELVEAAREGTSEEVSE